MKINLKKNMLSLFVLLVSGQALANSPNLCTTQDSTFQAPNVVVDDPGLAIGSPVTPWFGERTIPNVSQCSSNTTNTRNWRFAFWYAPLEWRRGDYRIDGKDYSVYAGIGARVGVIYELSAQRSGGTWGAWYPVRECGSCTNQNLTTGHGTSYALRYRLRLVKLGDIASAPSRTYDLPHLGYSAAYEYRYTSSGSWSHAGDNGHIWSAVGQYTYTSRTCDLAAGDVNRTIRLPTVRASDFAGSNDAGSRTDFNLTANCQAGISQVTYTFRGTPMPAYNLVFNNTGTSRNVGLTLHSAIGGQPQPIYASAPESRTVPTVSNRAVLPLRAFYWKTGTVSKGSFASAVTVQITYN